MSQSMLPSRNQRIAFIVFVFIGAHTIFYATFNLFMEARAVVTKDENQAAVLAASLDIKHAPILIEGSDCMTCHDKAERRVGPSFKEIAAHYPNNPETLMDLADKIIKGGQGKWGQLPMTPHPDMSKADAMTISKWIMEGSPE